MHNKGLSVVAAVALLTSVGAAYAKGPVTLTDSQLDKVTAGDAASLTTFVVGISTLESTLEIEEILILARLNPVLVLYLFPNPAI
jgi:hypothetical protein